VLALLTLRSGESLSGIRICTAAFRQSIVEGNSRIVALGQTPDTKATVQHYRSSAPLRSG
jgi:hypothetical protein